MLTFTSRRRALVATALAFTLVTAFSQIRDAQALTPNDPRYPEQWNLDTVRADEAWDFAQGSTSVKVALLDTGVGYTGTPADLVGNVGQAFDTFTGGNTASDDYGTYGSGTSNAGIIGARGNNARDIAGVTWNVTILPVKVCSFSGSCPHSNIASGINWAIARDVDIIQITPAVAATSTTLTNAVASAVNAGILVVAPSAEPGVGVGYPGSLPGVIAVGASTPTDTVATFSGGGPQLDLVAPGQSVLALASGGCCIVRSATALAASHVTGALALLLSRGVPASQAAQRLYDGAFEVGAAGWDSASGWGRLDVCGALVAANAGCSEACPDFDGNGWADLGDVLTQLQHFGEIGPNLPWDLDGDGGVALGDAVMQLNCIF